MSVMSVLSSRPMVLTIAGYASLKGLVISAAAVAFTNTWTGAVLIAVISGTLGIVGMVIAAWITARTYRENIHPELRDVKEKVGAAKRRGDRERSHG